MKVYEYLAEVLANNAIDVEEINSISIVYLKIGNKFNHTSWRIVRKELSTDSVPINPMHIEVWDDDINTIYRVVDSNGEELVMNIGVKLCNGDIFCSLYCTNPRLTPMIPMD